MNPLKKIAVATTKFKHARFAPCRPRHSDTYIVEFPKSGITWLSTLIANVALIESGRSEVVTFASVNTYVPDIHVSRDIGDLPYHRPPVRLIKSHSELNSCYHSVIYLARRPEAVMKSYFTYMSNVMDGRFMNFRDFCASRKYGLPAWRRHVDSWLRGADARTHIFLLRYEDLIKNTEGELIDLSEFFGWNISKNTISQTVLLSDLASMKADESRYTARNPRHNFEFIGAKFTGEAGDWLQEEVNKTCKNELSLLGYKD